MRRPAARRQSACCIYSFVLAGLLAGHANAVELLPGLPPGLAGHPARVTVLAWVERAGGGQELVVQLIPEFGAKIVADPGVVVRPAAAHGAGWTRSEVETGSDTEAYLPGSATLRLPFTGSPDRVAAEVTYAWCRPDRLCLFGETVVDAPVAGGG